MIRNLARSAHPFCTLATLALLAFVALAIKTATAADDPIFLAPVFYRIGGGDNPSIAIADVNQDGNPDVIAVVRHTQSLNNAVVSVLLGVGDGTFYAAVNYNAGGFDASSLAVGDVNGDGKLDIVVANRCVSFYICTYNPVQVLLGNGDGTFYTGATYNADYTWLPSIALGEFNSDGKLDLVLACGDHCISIAIGNGDGTFQPAQTFEAGGDGPNSVTVADVNRDGKLDLVIGCTGGCVAILLGNGDGTFQPARTYVSGGNGLNSVAVADFNGDGKPDLAVANECSVKGFDCTNSTPGQVDVYLGNGDGTFKPALEYNSGGVLTHSVAIADANGDGKPDLMLTNPCGSGCTAYGAVPTVSVLLGTGWTFQSAITYPTGSNPNYALALADFNHDGRPDLAVTDSGGVEIMINNVQPHDPTTTTLVSSANPSVYGQEITLSASVNSPSGTPTGIVNFYDGKTELGSVPLEGGNATLALYWLRLGSHAITAKYQGSLQFSVSASAPSVQIVQVAPTTTTITSSRNPSGPNSPLTLFMTVSNGSPLWPSGTVTLKDGTTTIATLPVNYAGWGGATLKTFFPNGIHSLTATYSGDGNDIASTSPPLMQYIGWFPVATVTTVSSLRQPSLLGQSVTLTANVVPANPAYGRVADGYLVTFYDGTTRLGSVALSHGTASFTTSFTTARIHYIKANYDGDSYFFKPSTGIFQQTVNKFPTVTTRWSSTNPSMFGHPVTLTAHVSSSGPNVPTGTIIFKDGISQIGTATLSNGAARITRSSLSVGTHPITAYYLGDSASAKSNSIVLNQVVE